MNSTVVSLEIENDLAIVTINNPPVNASSHAVRTGLADALLQTNENQALKAVILMCAGRTFVAGADIKEFGKPPQPPTLTNLISDIEAARIPWIAVLHGSVLGGGLEMALGCRYRIAEQNTSFGFPEVKLGLMPGAGGTVRLPRLIGMQEAINIITTGNAFNTMTAEKMGLVDEVVDGATDAHVDKAQLLLDAAKLFAQSNDLTQRQPLTQLPVIEPLSFEQLEQSQEGFKKKRLFAAEEALSVMRAGLELPAEESLKLEQQTFQKLRDSDQSKALRHLFFAERTVSKRAEFKNVDTRTINEVGIIGGGTMGAGIATSALLNGFDVMLIERDEASIENARSKIEANLANALKRKLITPEEHAAAQECFFASTQYPSLHDADLVIEAVFEDMDVKIDVFKELDKVTKPTAILASNTSYLDILKIANTVKDPSRVLGLHYFSPAHIMKLLEVIHTDLVSTDVLATVIDFAKRCGKIPVPAGNCRGFIGNRIMSSYRKASEYLIEDGALPHQVDKAMKNYGFPMGIFEMQDLAGLDIGWAMRKQLSDDEKSKTRYVDIADKICEAERFGRKTGSGYYQYSDGKTPERDPWVEQLIESESARKGINRREHTEAEIMDTILQQISDEANAILKEGIADSPEAIDVVMVNGYGFPRWRGGPLFAASSNDKN